MAKNNTSTSTEKKKSKISPLQVLWADAERELREKYEDEAKKYDVVKSQVEEQHDGKARKHHDKLVGFHNTLKRTRVFLRRSNRSKSSAVSEKIGKFLTVLKQLASVLDPVSAASPIIAQSAWTGICIVLTLCLNLTKSIQGLLKDIETVVDIIRLYSAMESRYVNIASSELRASIFPRTTQLFTSVLRFQALAAHHLNRHIVKRKFRDAFALDSWSDCIVEIRLANNDCLQALDQAAFGSIGSLQATMKKDIEQMKISIEKKTEKVVGWICKNQADSYHKEVVQNSDKFRDRGSWFVKHVNDWMENHDTQSAYWLHGIYGMGKTFLVSRVIEDFEQKSHMQLNRQLAYFYFSEERGGNSPSEAMRSLLAQLALTPDGSIAPSIDKLYSSRPAVSLGLKRCEQEMSVLVSAQTQTIIVIDALDECTDPQAFLRTLKNIIPNRKGSMKVLLSSKEGIKAEIMSVFPQRTCLTKKLDATTNEDDIKHYIDLHVKSRDLRLLSLEQNCVICDKPRTKGTCGDCKNRIDIEKRLIALLSDKCHGMFKWVELQLGVFFPKRRSGMTANDIKEKMQKLQSMTGEPQLDKVYAQIMERNTSGSEARRVAVRVYKWLLHSQLPLSAKVLTEAVSINPDGSKIPDVDIFDLCSNLIDISNNRVILAHPTIRGYLEQIENEKRSKVYSAIESHKEIATACLVSLENSSMPRLSSDMFKGTKWSFREYAAVFWPSHLSEVPKIEENGNALEDTTNVLRDLTNTFFFRKHPSTTFDIWARTWIQTFHNKKSTIGAETEGHFSEIFSKVYSLITPMLSSPPDPFFAACMLGLRDVCDKSRFQRKEKSQKRNLEDKLGVSLAIESRRLDALKMLTRAKVNVTETWQGGNNALHWASKYGTAGMINHLIDQGIDIASRNDQGATALHLAVTSKVGTIGKVERLISMGLHPHLRDTEKATVLHYAAKSPKISREMISILRKAEADFKAQDCLKKTSLHYAVQNLNISTDILKIFTDEADLDVVDGAGRTALSYLVASKSKDATKLAHFFLRSNPKLAVPSVLRYAVRNSRLSVSLIEDLISKDNINEVDEQGRTALHCAIIPCHDSSTTLTVLNRTKDIAAKLIKAGASCKIKDKNGDTALHYAARAPIHPNGLLDRMLKNKADAKAVNHRGETALHIALQHNTSTSATIILEFKSLINATRDMSLVDTVGETFLHKAARNKIAIEEVFVRLIDTGVDVNAKDCRGLTALHYILESGTESKLKLLVTKGARLDILDGKNASALHRAAFRKQGAEASMTAFLVKKGVDVNSRDESGSTPTHIAASLGDKHALVALLENYSADPLALTINKDTFLHCAVLNPKKSLDITKYLLGRKVDVAARNKRNETPLHLAAKKGSVEVVRELLKHGADPMIKTKTGETTLHYAARRDEPSREIIEALLDAKKSMMTAKNDLGETPLHLAIRSTKSSAGYCALLRRGASAEMKDDKGVRSIEYKSEAGSSALHIAATKNWIGTVKLLLEHKARTNLKNKDGLTPLCLAAWKGHHKVLETLLKAAASANGEDKTYLTSPLHLACRFGHHECVELLLKNGANVEAKNTAQLTPLMTAAFDNQERVARILLDHKADPNAEPTTTYGWTSLHRAASFGYTSVVRLLLQHKADFKAVSKAKRTSLYEATKAERLRTVELLLDWEATHSDKDVHQWKGAKDEAPYAKLKRRDKIVARLVAEQKKSKGSKK